MHTGTPTFRGQPHGFTIRRLPALLAAVLLAGAIAMSGGCGTAGELEGEELFAFLQGTDATLSAEQIGGPGSVLVYEGQEITGEVTVPANALVGVVKDGQAYLYHPALGDAELSETNSRRAVGYFIMGELEQTALNAKSIAKYRLPVGFPLETATGVDITRKNWTSAEVTNQGARWIAMKTGMRRPLEGEVAYFLRPATIPIETGYVSFLDQLSFGLLQNSGTRTINTPTDKIETFGSIVRAFPAIMTPGLEGYFGDEFWPGVVDAIAANEELFIRVNSVDAVHIVLGAVRSVAKVALPIDCLEAVVVDALGQGMLETSLIGGMTADPAVIRATLRDAFKSVLDSAAGCALEILAAPTGPGELVPLAANTALDIIAAGKWIIDTGVMGAWSVAKYSPYHELWLTLPERPEVVSRTMTLGPGEGFILETPADALNGSSCTYRIEYSWTPTETENCEGSSAGFEYSLWINNSLKVQPESIYHEKTSDGRGVIIASAPVFAEAPCDPGSLSTCLSSPTVRYWLQVRYDSFWEQFAEISGGSVYEVQTGDSDLPPCSGQYSVSVSIEYATEQD